jgi:hypothetical protein
VKPLDDLERRLSLYAAAVAAVFALALNVGGLFEPVPVTRAVIGLVMAAFLVVAARRGSRILTGFAVFLIAFGPWEGAWVVGGPFLVLGMWLWFRGKPSPEEIEERRRARDAKMAERRTARQAGRTGRGRGRSGASAESPSGPKASKRYTPPSTRRR